MNVTQTLQRAVGSRVKDYHPPRHHTVNGVRVSVDGSVSKNHGWLDMLREWLPKFENVGWLERLHKIHIGTGINNSGAIGNYQDGRINLVYDGEGRYKDCALVGQTPAHVLTHEMIHHAQITLDGQRVMRQRPERLYELQSTVSYYAGENTTEAVAEIGTGIIHGEEYPAWVHECYEDWNGPREVYDIG